MAVAWDRLFESSRSSKESTRTTEELDLDSTSVRRGAEAPSYFVYVLCSRNHRCLTVDCSPSLVQGVKFTRVAIALAKP